MTVLKDIYDVIDAEAPFHTALDFDNVGILVGDNHAPVHRVLLCLDITKEIVLEAVSKNADTIISHHPIIFGTLKELRMDSVPYLLAQHGISALCCHTNLDLSPSIGVNVALGKSLGFKETYKADLDDMNNPLFIGALETPCKAKDFAKQVKTDLNAKNVQLLDKGKEIKTVAFSCGAGASCIEEAVKSGADIFLTGEMDYHDIQELDNAGMSAITAGHFETECIYAQYLAKYLRKMFPEIGFITAETECNPLEAVI